MEIKSPQSAMQSITDEWERAQQLKKAAMEKCWSACQTGDDNQFKDRFQELSGRLSDSDVETLLERMVKHDRVEAARYLLRQGADPKSISLTVFASCCPSLDMFKLLAEHGMDFTSGSGKSNLLIFVLGRRDILDWLLDQGFDVNGRGSDHRSVYGIMRSYYDNTVVVLNRAAGKGDIELFDHLVARGAIPSRSLALHYASRSKNKNTAIMITHLIEKYGFDVNADEECGGLNEVAQWVATGCPLNWAATTSNLPAIKTLLKHGAHPDTACHISIKKKDTGAVKLLLEAGADPSSSLGTALIHGHFESVRLCLEHGGDIAIGRARCDEVSRIRGYSVMSKEMERLLSEWS